MAKRRFPFDLSEAAAREIHIHQAVQKGFARVFFREFEQRQKAAAGGDVQFRFIDAVYFFAVAAASGVVGNLAYDALAAAVRAVRKPKQEIAHGGTSLEAVVSRRTYNSLRRKKHPRARASRALASIEKELAAEYRLMVTLKRTTSDSEKNDKRR